MKMKKKKSQIKRFGHSFFWFIFLTAFFFHSGCGIVSLFGTPAGHEKHIPAEYNLTEHKDKKLLVLVNQPGWLGARVNLRYYLTKAMRENLIETIEIPAESLIDYDKLSEFRSNQPNFSLLSPLEIGRGLQADIVLLVVIENYQLYEMANTGFQKGFLSVQTMLLDAVAGEKLWPESAKGKAVKVGFEFEDRGQNVAVARLTTACAYCTVRYLYDCPKNRFKIADDRSGEAWEGWK